MRFFPAFVLFVLAASAVSAQTPAATRPAPVRWEYAELSYRNVPGRPAGKDADGNEVPATPDTVTIRWTTGAEEVSLKGWDEFADQLKAAPFRKDAAPAGRRIQALNALGAAGWEVVESQTTTATTATGFDPAGGAGAFGKGGDRGAFGQGKGGVPGDRGSFGKVGGGFAPTLTRTTTNTMLLKRRVP